MGKHTGDPAPAAPLPRRRLLGLALGITATLVAWGFLVWEAIDFGSEARGGENTAWLFVVLATIGATACLFLTLIWATRSWRRCAARHRLDPKVAGGRRAAR